MRALGVCALFLALFVSCQGYSSYRSSYRTSSSFGNGQSQPLMQPTAQLSSWAYSHLNEVRELANRLTQEYNAMSSTGSTSLGHTFNWSANIQQLSGKSPSELDALCLQVSRQLVADMRQGLISYNNIVQPSFFDSKAAEALEKYANTGDVQHTVDLNPFHPVDLSGFDEVKNYAYPAEVKVIDGKTYVVHRNCTEATKISNTYGSNVGHNVGQLNHGYYGQQPISSSSISQKSSLDWMRDRNEPTVMDYRSVVNVGNNRGASFSAPSYSQLSGVPTFGQVSSPSSSSTVTVRRVNKTITTHSDGTSSVDGSESQQRWVDGKLVYDNQQPFGQSSAPRDEQWKREEREHFFWYLTSPQRLEDWQHQQEDRLLGVVHRYQTTLPVVQEFHRRELARYKTLLGQYQSQVQDAYNWQRQERGRLDWLIHQNSLTTQEFERWQRENAAKLHQLAQRYGIQQEQLQQWQRQELQRLYVHFNKINESLGPNYPSHQLPAQVPSIPDSSALTQLNVQEQQRLDELIRQHNATIAQLQNSIRTDQQRLKDLSIKYQGDMQSQTQWLRGEVARIGDLIKEQNEQVTRLSTWQASERARLESMLKQHRGSITELQQQMAQDRSYVQNLAAKYRVGVDELEKWQREELERLQVVGQQQLENHIKDWQLAVSESLRNIIAQNQLTIEQFQNSIVNDRAQLEQFARTYKVRVDEIESWIQSEFKKFKSEGLLKDVQQELVTWQQKERERLQQLVQHSSLTVEQLEAKIKNDQSHFFELANTYQVQVTDIQDWLKKELLRLQSEGLLKAEALKDWQLAERQQIANIVQHNKYSIDEFERKVLADRARLNELAKTYNVQVSEIEQWIQSEGDRLQREGQLHMETQLNNWQKIERQRLLDLINKNNLSIEELELKIGKDQTHLYSLAQQNQVRVEEIEQWIKQQIEKLQKDGLLEMQRLQNWQQEWRGNLTNMVQERDYTVEEFHKWLLEDRARLQNLAMQHNVQIEEIEQFVKKEEKRFIGMGLLKPSERLTNWQEVERLHLKNLAQQQFKTTEQLEARLRQDREILEKLARQYSVQVEEIESWMKQELARMRDEGQLQIDNLTSWQLAERERLEALLKQNKQWNAEDLQAELRNDREHMQTMAFQYHTSVEEIDRWVQTEIERLQQQGKLNIEKLTAWQQTEQQRILSLLQSQSNITLEQFEAKVQNDRRFLINLADQHHVSVKEIETYVQQVIEELQQKGKFEVEQLQAWQLVERDYIKSMIAEFKNGLSTEEYERKLLDDRAHLNQLADQYRLNVKQIEEWMIAELKRLRGNTEASLKTLSEWQVSELERLQSLVKEQTHLSYVEFEMELQKERDRLQKLANQYSVNVEEIEQWMRQQLINLKTTGTVKVENLTKWQISEQERLIELLLKHQQDASYEEVERELNKDHQRLESLSQTNHVSIDQVDTWLHDELKRLQDSGLVQFEKQTQWQKQISNGFENWLQQQKDSTSYQEFVNFLKRDKARLNGIANDYHLTVDQVEEWVQKEAARLSIIGEIEKPQDNISYEQTNIWTQQQTTDSQPWKEYLTNRLRSDTRLKPMTWQEFKIYLIRNRPAHELLANQYHITVEDIHVWLEKSARQLEQEGFITGSLTVEEWQEQEGRYIQDLINQQLRLRQKWTIEELQLKLFNDQKHLLDVMRQYQISIEELKLWYNNELQRLLNLHKIEQGFGVQWQTKEMERIYQTVVRHPINRSALEQLLLRDVNNLAVQYHITVDELKLFIREKLQRLADMGLVVDRSLLGSDWKEQERLRLRQIGASVIITEQELVELLSVDSSYQKELARLYGIGLHQLAPVQRIHVGNMAKEQLLEHRRLNVLTNWQQKERDRLYEFIGTQNMTLRQLRDWQRQDEQLLERLAQTNLISLHELKAWQIKEFERIMAVAHYYGLTLTELQQFRDDELHFLVYLNHRKLLTAKETQNWESNQQRRLQKLESRHGKYSQELSIWRRTLYLLSQGLIDLPNNNNGGYIVDQGSADASAVNKPTFSKDRGDQPPHVYEENVNEDDEPGLEGETKRPLPSPLPQPLPLSSTPAPLPYQRGSPSGSNGGFEYRRTDYTFNVPVGSVSASANGGPTGSSASASAKLSKWTREAGDEPPSQQQEDLGQQQQEELGWVADDGQQQQQEETAWNTNSQQHLADFGQKLLKSLTVPPKHSHVQQLEAQPVEVLTKDSVGQQQQQEETAWNTNSQRHLADFGQKLLKSLTVPPKHSHVQQLEAQPVQVLTKDSVGQQQQQEATAWDSNYQQDGDNGQQQQQELVDKDDFGQQQVEDLTGQGYGHSYGSNYGQQLEAKPVEVTTEVSTLAKIKNKISGYFG